MIESRDSIGNMLHGEHEISTTWKDGIPSMEPTHSLTEKEVEPFRSTNENPVPPVAGGARPEIKL